MKRAIRTALVGLIALWPGFGIAQSQMPGQMPMPGQTPSPSAPTTPGMMGPAAMGGMCPMCQGGMCPMMGGGMMGGSGMMEMPGMMGAPAQDPKALGRMMQLRADLMRAMADVLAKHGKALEEGK